MAAERRAARTIRAEIGGNRLAVYDSGDRRLEILLEMIGAARSSLRMLFYMFNDDEVGRQVRDALVQAAARGVLVHVLIDRFGSNVPDLFFDPLREAGGDSCIFHPRYGRRYLLRNHQKLVIADDNRVLIGGANIDRTYLSDSVEGCWRDLWMSVEGPAVIDAIRYFDDLYRWTRRERPRLRALRRLVAEHSSWRGPVQWKFSGPLSRRNSWWRAIGRDLNRAKRLDMIFAYFAPPGAMVQRIGAVARRGRARIVTAAKSDNSATIAAARASYSHLLRRKVELYEYQPVKLHTKLVVVDDIVYLGSSNFDYRSLYINLELMLRIHDPAFADQMRRFVDGEIAESAHITQDVHARRAGLWRRTKWKLSHFLVNVMDYTVTRRLNFAPET